MATELVCNLYTTVRPARSPGAANVNGGKGANVWSRATRSINARAAKKDLAKTEARLKWTA